MEEAQRYAAIDMGSNAIRLLIVEQLPDHQRRKIIDMRSPVRLGQDVFLQGRITTENLHKVQQTMQRYRSLLDQYQVQKVRAVATSAARGAINKDRLQQIVQEALGEPLQIISGKEEARLVVLAMKEKLPLADKNCLLVDVGGGSVEIILLRKGEIAFTQSYKIGTVRLLVLFSQQQSPGAFFELIDEYIASARLLIEKELPAGRIDCVIGSGGNIEALARINTRFFSAESENGVSKISGKNMERIITRLSSLDYVERMQTFDLREDRADVIIPASLVYAKVMALAGNKAILVPGAGLKDGVLADLISADRENAYMQDLRSLVRKSALQLGIKFHFEQSHGEQVAALALQLFDSLHDFHNLGSRERIWLEAAALLHDIGYFISTNKHHKHAYYVIYYAGLVGLQHDELRATALIARYHRKSGPKETHLEFQLLPSVVQKKVTMLAALLRMADALDREHLQKVRSVRPLIGKEEIVLQVEATADISLEKWSFDSRSKMFADLVKRRVALERVEPAPAS